MSPGEGVTILTAITVIGTGVGGFISLQDSVHKQQEVATDHSTRIYRVELEQAAHARENALEMSIQQLKFEVQSLKAEIEHLESHRR